VGVRPGGAQDVLAIDLDAEGEVALGTLGELVDAQVRAIAIVGELVLDGALRAVNADLELLATASHVLVALGASADGELEGLDVRGVVVSTLLDVNGVRGVGNGGITQGDVDAVLASIVGSKGGGVGAIAVVLEVDGDGASGALDDNLEGIAAVSDRRAVGADGLDDEVGGEVVLDVALQSGAVDLSLGVVGAEANVDAEGRVLDVVIVERSGGVLQADNDLMGSSVGSMVDDLESAVAVVGDSGGPARCRRAERCPRRRGSPCS